MALLKADGLTTTQSTAIIRDAPSIPASRVDLEARIGRQPSADPRLRESTIQSPRSIAGGYNSSGRSIFVLIQTLCSLRVA